MPSMPVRKRKLLSVSDGLVDRVYNMGCLGLYQYLQTVTTRDEEVSDVKLHQAFQTVRDASKTRHGFWWCQQCCCRPELFVAYHVCCRVHPQQRCCQHGRYG